MQSKPRKRFVVVIVYVVLSLLFAQFPNTAISAVPKICEYEAAYPPDLPDCLDPVVAAQVAAAAKQRKMQD